MSGMSGMSGVNYSKLEKSLAELKEQYENYRTLDTQNLSDVNQRAVKNSVIKCFEFVYDTLWKTVKKYLQDHGIINMPHSPVGIFREAHKNLLIEDLEGWIDEKTGYNQFRIDSAHDYSEEKAKGVLSQVGNFIEDATEIYEKMTAENE